MLQYYGEYTLRYNEDDNTWEAVKDDVIVKTANSLKNLRANINKMEKAATKFPRFEAYWDGRGASDHLYPLVTVTSLVEPKHSWYGAPQAWITINKPIRGGRSRCLVQLTDLFVADEDSAYALAERTMVIKKINELQTKRYELEKSLVNTMEHCRTIAPDMFPARDK